MKNINRNEVNALIRLLDDSDSEIYQQIESRLIDLGRTLFHFGKCMEFGHGRNYAGTTRSCDS
ncbi:MAG: hypothetical protein IPP51_10170 [Bacteroidetes bacterium]|nr:hypothetical protein [Bacteroidota bacterium]